jgi:hypothetical protein
MSEQKTDSVILPQEKQKETTRNFYCKVAIVGQSGTGKSYLSKTADHLTTGYINMERKPLPYRQETPFTFIGQPKTWIGFKKNLEDYGNNPAVKTIIIDSQTMAFNVLIREMGTSFTGFDVYKNYNRQVYEYLELIKNIQKDIIVISHDELIKLNEGDKVRRMSTHGKEFEGKIEQHYSVILYTDTRIKDNKPQYFLRTFEEDTSTKVPEGMFSKDGYGETPLEIPNDAMFIFNSIEKYYTI